MCVSARLCTDICADFGKRSFHFAHFVVVLLHHKHQIIKQNMHYYQLEFNFNNREFDFGRKNYA